MYGMNFLFGNNLGFGGFCRPMISPFMLGAMQGYNSVMCAYSMMGGMNYSFPSLPNYSMNTYSYPGFNPSNIFQTPGQTTMMPQNPQQISTSESILRSQNLLNQLLKATQQLQAAVNGTATDESDEADEADEADDADEADEADSVDEAEDADSEADEQQSSSIHCSELKIDPDFMYKVQKIAADLKCSTDDLLAVMNAESGLDAQAQNISGRGAVGLIQFTDAAIEELNRHGCNITKEQLKNMDALEQLDYVEKYLKIAKSYKFSEDEELSAGDLYAIVFLPGRADREVLSERGESYYSSNIGLDINRDGKITKSELENRVNHFRISVVA